MTRTPEQNAARRAQRASARAHVRARATTVDEEAVTWLDGGPLARWLRELVERAGDHRPVAWRLGVPPGRVEVLLQGSRRLALDTVDRLLCDAGRPELLAEMYPALYAGLPEYTSSATETDDIGRPNPHVGNPNQVSLTPMPRHVPAPKGALTHHHNHKEQT